MRQELRERYNLEGDTNCFNSDICLTMCCPACTLIQEEKEVMFRNSQAAASGYAVQPGMQPPMQMQASGPPEYHGQPGYQPDKSQQQPPTTQVAQ